MQITDSNWRGNCCYWGPIDLQFRMSSRRGIVFVAEEIVEIEAYFVAMPEGESSDGSRTVAPEAAADIRTVVHGTEVSFHTPDQFFEEALF